MFDYGEDKTAAEKKFALLEDKTAPQLFLPHTAKTQKKDPQKMFIFGEINAATVKAPECCGPKAPCCSKPHIAFGEYCGKWQFQPKCCASTTAQQLINAMLSTVAACVAVS